MAQSIRELLGQLTRADVEAILKSRQAEEKKRTRALLESEFKQDEDPISLAQSAAIPQPELDAFNSILVAGLPFRSARENLEVEKLKDPLDFAFDPPEPSLPPPPPTPSQPPRPMTPQSILREPVGDFEVRDAVAPPQLFLPNQGPFSDHRQRVERRIAEGRQRSLQARNASRLRLPARNRKDQQVRQGLGQVTQENRRRK